MVHSLSTPFELDITRLEERVLVRFLLGIVAREGRGAVQELLSAPVALAFLGRHVLLVQRRNGRRLGGRRSGRTRCRCLRRMIQGLVPLATAQAQEAPDATGPLGCIVTRRQGWGRRRADRRGRRLGAAHTALRGRRRQGDRYEFFVGRQSDVARASLIAPVVEVGIGGDVFVASHAGHRREHLVDEVRHVRVRRVVSGEFEQLHFDFAIRIDRKDARARNVDAAVAESIGDAVAKASVKRRLVAGLAWIVAEQARNVAETGHLEHLRLAQNDFAVQRRDEPVRAHDHGAVRQLVVVLIDAAQIVARNVRLPNRTRREVHEPVPVLRDVVVQLGYAEMRPVPAHERENVAEGVRLGDRAVNVAHDHGLVTVPQEHARTARRDA